MKKYITLILVGIILVLAAVLAGVLFFMKNHPRKRAPSSSRFQGGGPGAGFGPLGAATRSNTPPGC